MTYWFIIAGIVLFVIAVVSGVLTYFFDWALIVAVVAGIMAIICLVLGLVFGIEEHNETAPCSEFKNGTINSVPVRCYKELGILTAPQ